MNVKLRMKCQLQSLGFGLSMTNSAVDFRVDVLVFFVGDRIPVFVWFPSKIGDLFDRTQMRLRITVAGDAPSHRQLFMLIDDFHLVDATVAGLAADTRVHVSSVVEIDEFRQVVDSFPRHALAGLPTLLDRSQFFAGWMNSGQSGDPLLVRRAYGS